MAEVFHIQDRASDLYPMGTTKILLFFLLFSSGSVKEGFKLTWMNGKASSFDVDCVGLFHTLPPRSTW